jgi:CRP-like cAMP-binding protein
MVRHGMLSLLLAVAVAVPSAARPADIAAALAASDVFAGVASEDLARLGALAEVRSFATGATLMSRGERSPALYILGGGAAEVRLADGRAVASVGKGVTLGEMEFADGGPLSASVVMTKPGEVILIDTATLRAFLETSPAVGYRVMDNVARKVSANLRRMNEARCP